jgi:8-oxo-dGTP pyrophosphatase MutT (NUDIX family)
MGAMAGAAEKLVRVEEALRRHRPAQVALDGEPARAAVAMLLEPKDDDVHVFLIHRAEFEGDPWSGHMALPGGRKDQSDPSVMETVVREVYEEVGIDLARSARLITPLDEVQGVARGRQLPLVISPFVFAVEEPWQPRPNHEVQGVLWVPLAFLADPRSESMVDYKIGGERMRLPAFVYQGRTIWGLTFRMIRSFLDVVGPAVGG